MSKYTIPVSIITTASSVIGEVECDNLKEFQEKAYALWEKQDYDYPIQVHGSGFDLCDWEISELKEADLKYYENPTEEPIV